LPLALSAEFDAQEEAKTSDSIEEYPKSRGVVNKM
jgi:hypothetical protein